MHLIASGLLQFTCFSLILNSNNQNDEQLLTTYVDNGHSHHLLLSLLYTQSLISWLNTFIQLPLHKHILNEIQYKT